ncbi:MUB1/samB family protein [Pleurotus pulmonarius]
MNPNAGPIPLPLPPLFMPPPNARSSAKTRIRQRQRRKNPYRRQSTPAQSLVVTETEEINRGASSPTSDLDKTEGSSEPGETEGSSDDEPFAPDKYKPGFHYFHNRRCTNAECRREIPRKSLKRCGTCYTVTYCTTECQEVDWKNHKEVCQPIPRGQHTRAITQFNYRYGRYIHALALHVLGYSELPRSHERRDMTRERLDAWKKTSNRYAVVLHLRQNDHTTHFHPYHDYRLASVYRYHVSLLDIIEQGCKARAQALLGIRQEEMTCVVVILFENKAGMGIGHSCFLHKVDEFGVNDYPRVSHHIAPQAFRRILLHKARKVRPDNVA